MSLGGHGRSRALGSQDESGDSMGHGGFGVSVSNGGKLPPRKFLGNSTTSRGHSGGANVKGHSGGAGSRGRSESAKLDRTRGEGELGGTSGDEGELGGTSGDEGELGGTGWGADSASSWDGAGSGADSASSWDGADLGMPAARTDTSGGSNTLVISPGQRGASAGVVAILAGDSGLAGLARADSGLAGLL